MIDLLAEKGKHVERPPAYHLAGGEAGDSLHGGVPIDEAQIAVQRERAPSPGCAARPSAKPSMLRLARQPR